MPFANNYTPTVGFATEESTSVAGRSTVRTVAVDTELANISTSINALNTNIKLLQRDDGKLKDGLIEPYALSEQSRALIASGGTPRGAWLSGQNYAVGDAVQYASAVYLCVTAHTSTISFASGLFMAISGDGSSFVSAGESAASAALALSYANAASSSASAASTSSSNASTYATNSSNSATASNNSAIAAAASALEAASVISSSTAGASQAEAEAGVDNAKYMSALRVKQSITANVPATFPSGTRMTFNQTAAPTGWTKDITAGLNDSIMRIVTGTVGSGGSNAFTTFNGQTATNAYTLTTADIPSHSHIQQMYSSGNTTAPPATSGFGVAASANATPVTAVISTQSAGTGGAHSHGLTHGIKYNDFIIASKN